jgi:hypothetical protein
MALRRVSTANLRKEIARREKGATKLLRSRDKLAKALSRLESELADLGPIVRVSGGGRRRKGARPVGRPSKAGASRRRAKNKLTLADALAGAVRAGSVVSPADAAKRVRANGYKSSSKTFGIQVATTLAKHKRFKRTGRGQYERRAD